MATHSSILPWRIPGTGEPGRLQPMELQRVRHDLATTQIYIYISLGYTSFSFGAGHSGCGISSLGLGA